MLDYQNLAVCRARHPRLVLLAGYGEPSSPPTSRMHDLNLVVRIQTELGVPAAGHDFAVHFHGDAFAGQVQLPDQLAGGEPVSDRGWGAVEQDLHCVYQQVEQGGPAFYRSLTRTARIRLTVTRAPLEWQACAGVVQW